MTQTSYLSEIQAMMYAMGDCRRPLVETAVLLEQIVLRQLRSVYVSGAMSENLRSKPSPTSTICSNSGSGGNSSLSSAASGLSSCTITPQDCKSPFTAENLLTAVVRRDRNIARRLIAYLKLNDLKFSIGRSTNGGETGGEFFGSIEPDDEEIDADLNEDESIASDETSIMEFATSVRCNRQPKGRRIRFCERVLRQLNAEFNCNSSGSAANEDENVAQRAKRRKTSTPDPTGDAGAAANEDSATSSLIDEFLYKSEENLSRDQAKIERRMRAARYAAEMDTGEYMCFSEARQVTFLSSACQKQSRQASRRFLKWILGVCDEKTMDEETTFDQDFLENQLRLKSWVDLLSADDIIVDILNFLAREILSLLVDCAFFVKRECRPLNNNSTADIYRVRPIAQPPPAPRSCSTYGGNLGVKNASDFRESTSFMGADQPQFFGGYTTSNNATSSTNGRKRPLEETDNEDRNYNCPTQVPISSSEVTASLVDALTQRALTTCNSRLTTVTSQQSTDNNNRNRQPTMINLTIDKTALQCWEVREAFRRLEYFEKFRKI